MSIINNLQKLKADFDAVIDLKVKERTHFGISVYEAYKIRLLEKAVELLEIIANK